MPLPVQQQHGFPHRSLLKRSYVSPNINVDRCRPLVRQALNSAVARPGSNSSIALLSSCTTAKVATLWERSAQCAAVTALGVALLLGRSSPAVAGILPRPAPVPVETMVAIAPPAASVTASVTSPNDSMLLIVVVCLGFWMLSATISAAIGAIMHLSGRSLQYATRGAANWTSAGIMDTFDIMRLPLAYELEEPSKGPSKGRSKKGSGSNSTVVYVPWEGPEDRYIPVNMVKVLRPGFLEAGLVVKQPLIQPGDNLTIISITSSGQETDATLQQLPGDSSNGHHSNGNGNGRTNGKHKS